MASKLGAEGNQCRGRRPGGARLVARAGPPASPNRRLAVAATGLGRRCEAAGCPRRVGRRRAAARPARGLAVTATHERHDPTPVAHCR